MNGSVMSHIALHPVHVRPNWLAAVVDWLRQARVAVKLPLPDVENLSDRQLRDIGVGRKDVTRAMDRETDRLGLLGLGWQQPRR